MRTLSLDLRERILTAYDNKEGTREEIAARFRVSLGMVKKLLQEYRAAASPGRAQTDHPGEPSQSVPRAPPEKERSYFKRVACRQRPDLLAAGDQCRPR